MSIKPVAMIPENELKHIEDRRTALVVPVCEEWSDRACVMLYAIPDTHRVVSVELLEKCTERLIAGAKAFQILQDQFGVKDRIAPGRIACETLSDELCAIIEDKP